MKTADQLKPNYGPVYAAALYPDLAKICHKHGYALAVHGSLARDFDLIAVPWTESPSDPGAVVGEITREFAVNVIGEPSRKPHGRIAHTLSFGFGQCAADLSFFPGLVPQGVPDLERFVSMVEKNTLRVGGMKKCNQCQRITYFSCSSPLPSACECGAAF